MIFAIIVGLAGIAFVAVAAYVNAEIERLQARFDILLGGVAEAGALADTRARLRDRQKRVEEAVAAGTSGIESAHRSLARRFGRPGAGGAGLYAGIHRFNRGAGRVLARVLAARGSRPRDVDRASLPDETRVDESERGDERKH